MCGFTGWYSKQNLKTRIKTLKKMTDTLKYRGPDGKGYYIGKNILLGHRRLAIIDIKNGKQPMSYNGYTIVYNGELYNTEEIKKKLKSIIKRIYRI